MSGVISPSNQQWRWGACLALAAALTGCATPAGKPATKSLLSFEGNADTRAFEGDTGTRRSVQAIRLDSTITDGQTSWILEPDVPRIPEVAGLDAQLPPHIECRMRHAFDLAQRGATFSAHAELRSVLGLCAFELDARSGGTSHREALYEGLTALDEADQFALEAVNWRGSTDARLVAISHITPVLKQMSSPIDPIHAAQAYYAFAEERLTYACGELQASSLAFYGLARTCVVPGSQIPHAAGKAALLQRVALSVAPQNVLAGNELGVLLVQHGCLDEAEQIFQQCVATDATPESWRNLAVVYARKGDEHSSRKALAAGEALAMKDRGPQTVLADAMPNDALQDTADESDAAEGQRGTFARFNIASKFRALIRR